MKNIHIVDVREPYEYAEGHVKGAENIPLSAIQRGELDLPKSDPIIVYCRTGRRAEVARKALEQRGFLKVTNGINQSTTEKLLS